MKTKKNLIVYYSRTGTSEIISKILREKLACDMDRVDYAGKTDRISFPAAGWEALRRTTKEIKGTLHKPEEYDRVFFVSPVWAGGLATPIRSYMKANKGKIKSYSLVITCGGTALKKAVKDAQASMGYAPEASAEFKAEEIKQGKYQLNKLFKQYKDDTPPEEA